MYLDGETEYINSTEGRCAAHRREFGLEPDPDCLVTCSEEPCNKDCPIED